MKLLKIYPTSINERFLDEAVKALNDGCTIIFPTDSYYALGCDALDNRAIERLCHSKKIDLKKDQLSILCSDISMASEYAKIDNKTFRYLREYLPGAVTFILPAATTLPKAFKGRKTVGVRIAENPIAEQLCKLFGKPIMVSSATLDDPALNGDPEEIALNYAQSATLLLDGGSIDAAPSTIVDLTDSSSPEVLRQGKVEFEP